MRWSPKIDKYQVCDQAPDFIKTSKEALTLSEYRVRSTNSIQIHMKSYSIFISYFTAWEQIPKFDFQFAMIFIMAV